MIVRARDIEDINIAFPWDMFGDFVGNVWDGVTGKSQKEVEKAKAEAERAKAEAEAAKAKQIEIANNKNNKKYLIFGGIGLIATIMILKK